jgi:hypothetical protein
MLQYSADQLRALNRDGKPPLRRVCKGIFSLRLWLPKCRHTSRAVNTTSVSSSSGDSGELNESGLTVGLLNARSVTNKSTAIADTITTKHVDVLAVTETWHQSGDDVSLKRCAPPGYAILDVPRCSPTATRGGGVALVFSKRFSAKRFTFAVQPTTFEVLGCSLRSATTAIVYIVIYRSTNEAPSELFF